MGGGHITRENEYRTEPDPKHPLTEFYLLLQDAVSRRHYFEIPGCWGCFIPPDSEPLYEENIPEYCHFSSKWKQGWPQVAAPRRLSVLYETMIAERDVTPAALILTEEGTRRTFVIQLEPPFAGAGVAVPAIPDGWAALRLRITPQDLDLIDRNPRLLAERMLGDSAEKQWIKNPSMDAWMRKALALAQREKRRNTAKQEGKK